MLKKKSENIIDWEYEDENGSLIGWLIIEAACKNKYLDAIVKEGEWDSHKVNVELIINDVKVPATSTLNSIETQLDRMVEDKAKKILKEKVSHLIDGLEQLEETIEDQDILNIKLRKKGEGIWKNQ